MRHWRFSCASFVVGLVHEPYQSARQMVVSKPAFAANAHTLHFARYGAGHPFWGQRQADQFAGFIRRYLRILGHIAGQCDVLFSGGLSNASRRPEI